VTEREAYHAFKLIQNTLGVQQANGIATDQASERISDNADLGDLAARLLDRAQLLFNLGANALTSALYTIVGKATNVALCEQQAQLSRGIQVAQTLGDVPQVIGIPPQPVNKHTQMVGRGCAALVLWISWRCHGDGWKPLKNRSRDAMSDVSNVCRRSLGLGRGPDSEGRSEGSPKR